MHKQTIRTVRGCDVTSRYLIPYIYSVWLRLNPDRWIEMLHKIVNFTYCYLPFCAWVCVFFFLGGGGWALWWRSLPPKSFRCGSLCLTKKRLHFNELVISVWKLVLAGGENKPWKFHWKVNSSGKRLKTLFKHLRVRGLRVCKVALGKASITVDQFASKSDRHFSILLPQRTKQRRWLDGRIIIPEGHSWFVWHSLIFLPS